jgi:hypothetical protein
MKTARNSKVIKAPFGLAVGGAFNVLEDICKTK